MYGDREDLSFADFIVLGSYTAAQVAVANKRDGCNGGPCSLELDFTSGRRDCSDSNGHKDQDLPAGQNINAPVTHVQNKFGLTSEEMVAAMGKYIHKQNIAL